MDVGSLFGLQGKNALVTGGGRGIGEMIAQGLVEAGCSNVYLASRNKEACDGVAARLNSLQRGTVHSFQADLNTLEGCQRLVDAITNISPSLHILVNNSGNNWAEPFDSYPDKAWERVLTLNLRRVFTLTQLCAPLLRKAYEATHSPSRVIHIGSVDGISPSVHPTYAYGASKAALHHLSRQLAAHLGSQGITSNVIACGPFQSKMMRATLDKFGDQIRAGVPLGRIGSPQDVAGTAVYLASRAGEYTNGATIVVDGGAILSKM